MEQLNNKVDGAGGAQGSLPAAEWNQVPSELQNIITALGITLSSGDLDQLGKAIAGYVATGDFYTDSGAVNSYVLSVTGGKQRAPAYVDGMRVRFVPDNTNSGASTVNVGGLGVKNLTLPDGSALPSGNVIAGTLTEISFNNTDDRFEFVQSFPIASQAEAEAGTDNNKGMTPLRVKQAVDFYGVRNDLQNETVEAGLKSLALTPSTDFGGKFVLEVGDLGPTLVGDVVIDMKGNRLRIYESGGSARGVELDISTLGASSASDFLTTADSLGHGQTYQVLTGSRASGVTYTNTTGQPIFVYVYAATTINSVVVGGVTITNTTEANEQAASFIVPEGATYSVTFTGAHNWSELR